MHPRLLSTLVLYEPVILGQANGEPNPAFMSTVRRDLWDSRAAAESSLRKAFRSWDPRATDRYLRYGLRDVPTALYDANRDPNIAPSAVTLTTSKHQEAWAYAQPNLEPCTAGLDRLLLPDWDLAVDLPRLYSRPECSATMRNLPYLRPSVFYVFGGKSPLSHPNSQDEKVNITGTGIGGSGGLVEGKVGKAVFEKSGHLLVFEHVDECARVSADWIDQWFRQWLAEEEFHKRYRSKKSDDAMLRSTQAWVATTTVSNTSPRPRGEKERL